MPRTSVKKRDNLKRRILESLKYGIVKTTSQVSTEVDCTWTTAYVSLTELERESRVICIPSVNGMVVWRLKE